MAGIKEWWGGQSKTAKTLYIVGTIATIGTIIYFATRKKGDDKKTSSDNKASQDIPDNTTTTETSGGDKGASTTNTTTTETTTSKSDLPNGGVGCGSVITNYDRDFDYVKCNDVWYTKSKANAASPYARGLYKDWKSLEGNKVATERLNRKYPK